MIQVRNGMFETNSSSTMTLSVSICQVDELEIPPVVHIESGGFVGDRDLNGCYAWAEWNNQIPQFLGLLKYSGVKEIYVDGKPVDADPEDRFVKLLRPEAVLAMCFGDFKGFSEWSGYGGEWDSSQYLTKEQIKMVQTFMKDPRYIIICTDGDGNEIDWDSTRFSKMVITDAEIEAEREYLANKAKYDDEIDEYYYGSDNDKSQDDDNPDHWEDCDFYISKQNRYKARQNKNTRHK